jgi:hypothetical protein
MKDLVRVAETKKRLGLFDILRLAGRAHGVLSDPLELLSALFALVVLALDTVRRHFHVDRSSDSAHFIVHLTVMDRSLYL